MYHLFLTSNFGASLPQNNRQRHEEHGLSRMLAERWPQTAARCLFMASYPDEHEAMRRYGRQLSQACKRLGLPVKYMHVADHKYPQRAAQVERYDVVILAGGHVPTENAFFHEVNLAEHLHSFEGIIIGISAGSMNSATTVYAAPEEEGEAVDPAYSRYLQGLGLTEISVLPHFQHVAGTTLDGLAMLEEILLPDSAQRPFMALPDGSFILEEEGKTWLGGPAYWIENGTIEPLGTPGQCLII